MAKKIRTDSDVVEQARKIDQLLTKVVALVHDIQNSEHPNKKDILELLFSNDIPTMAWASHVIKDGLSHPDKWETGNFGIRRKNKQPVQA